ncbi:branched-chain amino acid ABC transporter, permease protein [Leifsonia aquatica ATCC 14665]|uniref:Branched-chain amino acid ABC transporter, permease protein n=2 Tax=Leifsonia aquatica TaxID=144185 RepID=U2RTK7_LEIAQ|nr:branched-chain amino acid ABC transporter, permease protein [Leifsonia aquatica ATCC 14665]MBB2968210.1 fructose transport system permease protein [Leifsonia aquatica]
MTSTTSRGELTAAEAFKQRPVTGLQRIQRVLHKHPAISPFAVLVLAVIVFSIINERFLYPANLSLILQQVAIVGALAVAQTLVILTAGIDLSVGALMVLVSIVMGNLAGVAGLPGPIALLVGLLLGAAAGLLNGVLVAQVKLPPFITTLGTLSIFTALALLLSNGQVVDGDKLGGFLTWTATSFAIGPFNFTTGVLLVIVMYLVMGFVLSQTPWGRHVYAVGSDPAAARLAGISTKRVLLSVYVVAGILVALSAWVLLGRNGAATTSTAVDANLDSITAVVIGGTSLFGGRGRLLGTFLGAVIVGVFRNGLSLARVDVLYQTLAIGILIIAAVALDQWIRKTGAKR